MYACVWLLLPIRIFWNSSMMLQVSTDWIFFYCIWFFHLVNIWYVLEGFHAVNLSCLQPLVSYPCLLSEDLWGRIIKFTVALWPGCWNSKSWYHPKGSAPSSLEVLMTSHPPFFFFYFSSLCNSAIIEVVYVVVFVVLFFFLLLEIIYHFLDFSLFRLICTLRSLKDFFKNYDFVNYLLCSHYRVGAMVPLEQWSSVMFLPPDC